MAMGKAKVAVVIVILALLQVSCATAWKNNNKPYYGGNGGTPALLTFNGFQQGEDGGGPSECDSEYHSDDELIVALSTQWYENGKRCGNMISITRDDNGLTVKAKVVDECDSTRGCRTNIVDASKAVWNELNLDTVVGEVHITWSDA